MTLSADVVIIYRHIFKTHNFLLSSSNIRRRIGDMPTNHPDVYCFTQNYLSANIF